MFKARKQLARLAAPAVALSAVLMGPAFAGDHAPNRSAAPGWCGDRCDEVVMDWSATGHQVMKVANGYGDPMAASRVFAMMHLAMHDAINSVDSRYATYLPMQPDAGADAVVAAATAAHKVLSTLFPQQVAIADATLAQTLLDAGVGAAVTRGKTLGERVGAAMLEARANDGSAGSEPYQPGTGAGQYRFTPGFNFIAAPHWRSVQPFGLTSPSQFRLAPPPALTSYAYTRDFNEVKSKGRIDSFTRTQDETNLAAFWYEFSDIGWNRIARTVARERKQDLWDRARTFALLNVAMADAYIAGWDSKMHYDFWRPVTAIQVADIDGNAATAPDAAWLPMMPTPPIQDYPSTHSALGAAAAAVLTDAFGPTRFAFTSTSALSGNAERKFQNFWHAAHENARSRVMAGIHFRFSCEAGLQLGSKIGRHSNQQLLAPVK